MSIEYEEQLAGSLVDSFPKDFGYGVENMDMMQENLENSPSADNKPRILLMGLRRSGKSSIQKVRSHLDTAMHLQKKYYGNALVLDTTKMVIPWCSLKYLGMQFLTKTYRGSTMVQSWYRLVVPLYFDIYRGAFENTMVHVHGITIVPYYLK